MKRHIKLKKKSRKYEKKRLIVTEMRKNKKPRVKSTERKRILWKFSKKRRRKVKI